MEIHSECYKVPTIYEFEYASSRSDWASLAANRREWVKKKKWKSITNQIIAIELYSDVLIFLFLFSTSPLLSDRKAGNSNYWFNGVCGNLDHFLKCVAKLKTHFPTLMTCDSVDHVSTMVCSCVDSWIWLIIVDYVWAICHAWLLVNSSNSWTGYLFFASLSQNPFFVFIKDTLLLLYW